MPYLETNAGARIFYTIDGPADATKHILLIHGWCCDSHDWIFQIPYLRSLGFRVITPDLRGHGRSLPPTDGPRYTCEAFAGDMAEVLYALEIKQTIVVAHSMGAKNVAASLATDPQFSSLVTAVVLVDPIYTRLPFGSTELKQSIEMFQSPNANEFTAAFMDSYGMAGAETPAWLNVWHVRRTLAMVSTVIGGCYRDSHETPNIGLAEFAAEGWNARRVPWLVITATDERADVFRNMERREGDEIVVLGGGKCGHWLFVERWEEFNALLKRWLDGRGVTC